MLAYAGNSSILLKQIAILNEAAHMKRPHWIVGLCQYMPPMAV